MLGGRLLPTENKGKCQVSGLKKIALASEIRVLFTYERVFESDRYKTQVRLTGHRLLFYQ